MWGSGNSKGLLPPGGITPIDGFCKQLCDAFHAVHFKYRPGGYYSQYQAGKGGHSLRCHGGCVTTGCFDSCSVGGLTRGCEDVVASFSAVLPPVLLGMRRMTVRCVMLHNQAYEWLFTTWYCCFVFCLRLRIHGPTLQPRPPYYVSTSYMYEVAVCLSGVIDMHIWGCGIVAHLWRFAVSNICAAEGALRASNNIFEVLQADHIAGALQADICSYLHAPL